MHSNAIRLDGTVREADHRELHLAEGSGLRHLRHHSLYELGVAIAASRFEEMLNLDHQLVNGRIADCDPGQSSTEFERAVEICRTLTAGFRKNEIRNGRHCPRR